MPVSFPMSKSTLETSFICFILASVFYATYNAFLHPLRKIPGPFFASLTPVWELADFLSGRSHETPVRLHEKYGQVVRIGPNKVLVNDSDTMAAYWNWDKSDWWLAFRAHPKHIAHGMIFEASEHNRRKRLILPGYTLSNALKNESRIDKHVNTFTSEMRKRLGQTFDFAPWAQFAAFDIVMDMVFSNPIDFMKAGSDIDGIIKSLHTLLFGANVIAFFPSLMKVMLVPWIHKLIAPTPGDKSGPGQIHGLAFEQIRRRYDDADAAEKYSDVLQIIMDKNHDTNILSKAVLEQEAIAPILAGSDSVAAHVRAVVLFLTTNSVALSRLKSEIDTADAKGLLSDVPRFSQVRDHIPYFELVHREAMRIYPQVGSTLPRKVPKGGYTVNGHYLPAGTMVGVSQWAVGRSKEIFGEDVEVFRPERWDENEFNGDIQKQKTRDLAYIPFSKGPMMCTGHNIAKLEISKLLVQIFRLFDVQIVNPLQPFKDMNNLTMVQWDFWIRLTERKSRPIEGEHRAPASPYASMAEYQGSVLAPSIN